MSLAAIASLAQRLLQAYAIHAWPFAILHLIVVAYLARSILRIRREATQLRAWDPMTPRAEGPAALLSDFVRDSADLGARGFVVAITDYSDRLCSEIQSTVDEVAARVNMLLLVGIAGTLFGVFEFAARATAVQGDRLSQIGFILTESVAKAFPVGFIGLMLMLTVRLAVASPVANVHAAVSDATRRALEHRGAVSLTLADSIGAAIADAMRPVSTLDTTVSHLQPILTTLGERLDASLSLVKTQFAAIDQGTDRFIGATADLRESATAMTTTATRLEEILRATPALLASSEKLQQLYQQTFQEIGASFRSNLEEAAVIAASLRRVCESAEVVPELVVRNTAEAVKPVIEQFVADAAGAWQSVLQRLSEKLAREHAAIREQTRGEMIEIQDAVRAAASEWERVARETAPRVTEPLRVALEGITAAAERAVALTGDLAISTQAAAADLVRLPESFAERSASSIQPVFERVAAESTSTWHDLVRVVAVDLQRDHADFVASSRREVVETNQHLRAAADEMRRLSEGAHASLTEPLQTAIETARREASTALAEVSTFVRERYPAIREDMQSFGTEMAAIVQALNAFEQRLRFAGLPARSAHENGQSQAEILKAILAEVQIHKAETPETIWHRLFRPLRSRR